MNHVGTVTLHPWQVKYPGATLDIESVEYRHGFLTIWAKIWGPQNVYLIVPNEVANWGRRPIIHDHAGERGALMDPVAPRMVECECCHGHGYYVTVTPGDGVPFYPHGEDPDLDNLWSIDAVTPAEWDD